MEKYVHHSEYFCGNKVSEYGLQHNRVDYRTLASSFQHVLNNNVMQYVIENAEMWEEVNGCEYNEETDEYTEVFQYYIISDAGFEILSSYTDELVWYNEKLDMYVWGVTHYGTSWDYVLTDIRIEKEMEV